MSVFYEALLTARTHYFGSDDIDVRMELIVLRVRHMIHSNVSS
jgi:hypothetical protein